MVNKELSVIIPFLNEGEEVENTLKSIFENSDNNVDVILINDHSDDNFDYKSVIAKYDVNYIENNKRIGVAASRDLGVDICKTDYFLLLDAHMRFYNKKWIEEIVNKLEKHSKTLLCCQTKVLRNIDGFITEDSNQLLTNGAYIELYNPMKFLEPKWIYKKDKKILSEFNNIPCVLGAGYACSKSYWKYLKGLEGLMIYGSDEPFISLKVWMEGGVCRIVDDVVIGHVYRDVSPYAHDSFSRVCNRIIIAYLLLPSFFRKKVFAVEKFKNLDSYMDSMLYIYENYNEFNNEKLYFNGIFKKKFSEFESLNRKNALINSGLSQYKINSILLENVIYVIKNLLGVSDLGLINGKMGIAIFLFHYAKYSNNAVFRKFANTLLNDILKEVTDNLPLNLSSGLLGIGWGIEYLYNKKFVTGDTNDILHDVDRKVMEISPSRIHNYAFLYGFGGIVRYLLSRLYTIENENKTNPFISDFLHEVYEKSKCLIENKEKTDCVETYIEYVLYFERKNKISSPCIYDILILPNWNKYSKSVKKISLEGLLGLSLELILNSDRVD